jgi:hypothetical protein
MILLRLKEYLYCFMQREFDDLIKFMKFSFFYFPCLCHYFFEKAEFNLNSLNLKKNYFKDFLLFFRGFNSILINYYLMYVV